MVGSRCRTGVAGWRPRWRCGGGGRGRGAVRVAGWRPRVVAAVASPMRSRDRGVPGGAGAAAEARTDRPGRMARGRDRSIGAAPTHGAHEHQLQTHATNRVEQRHRDRARARTKLATRPCQASAQPPRSPRPEEVTRMAKIGIVYYSMYGATYELARAIAEGVEKGGGEVHLRRVPGPPAPRRGQGLRGRPRSDRGPGGRPARGGRRAARLRRHRLRLADPLRQRHLAAAGLPRHHRTTLAERCAGRQGSRVLHRRGHDARGARVDHPHDVDLRLPPGHERRPRRLRHRSQRWARRAAGGAPTARHSSATARD
jgi:hypothetical protein